VIYTAVQERFGESGHILKWIEKKDVALWDCSEKIWS
jgi:hypothetical protein